MTLTIGHRNRLLEILPRYEEKATGRKRANIEQVFYAYQTYQRYFQEWMQNGVWRKAWQVIAQDMEDENLLKLSESIVDGSIVL